MNADSLIFSDNHIAQHKRSINRLHDCINALEWAFTTALKHKIKNIFFAGDLFQDREKIDIIAYHLTFDIISKYCNNNDIKLYMLLGNHDLWFHERWDIHSIRPFSAIKNVEVIDKPCTLSIDGCNVDFLPFTHNPLKYLDELNSKLLIGHIAIDGAKLNSNNYSDIIIEHDGEMTRLSSDSFKKWDKVYLGHYHAAQVIDNIEYVGSPLELTWGEADQEKHIIKFNLKTLDQEYVVNDFSPKHLLLSKSNIDKYDIKKHFIKLIVDDMSSTDLIDIRKKIEKKKPATLDILSPVKSKNDEHFIENAKAILHDLTKMLEEYVNSVELDKSLDKEILLKKGQKVCENNK